MLIPGLLLGTAWDRLGMHLFRYSGLYWHPIEAIGGAIVATRISLRSLLGNVLFVQNILCQPLGSNAPLWSLTNEFWYYVLFPLCLLVITACIARRWKTALGFLCSVVVVLCFLNPEIRRDFLIWLLGCALVFIYAKPTVFRKQTNWIFLVGAFCALCCALAFTRVVHDHEFAGNLVLGLAFTMFLYAVLQSSNDIPSKVYAHSAKTFAGFSFSLYVLHAPFLVFLKGWFVPSNRWQPDLHHLTYGWLISFVALGLAWSSSLLTERNTDLVRHWAKVRLLTRRHGRLSRPSYAVGSFTGLS